MKRSLLILLACAAGTSVPLRLCGQQTRFEKIADAIYVAEGGAKARVLSVKVRNQAHARRVCLRTIENAWTDYSALRTPRSAFIDYLADRYCPPSSDPVGNRNWKHNVNALIK